MSCDNPISIRSKAIGATSKMFMLVPCGKCLGCLKMRQNQWIYRLQRESAVSHRSMFVTLTYDPEHVPFKNVRTGEVLPYNEMLLRKSYFDDCVMTLHRPDLQKFFKRLRKYGVQFKYFAAGEYGDQFDRPHYHIAFFTDIDMDTMAFYINKAWQLGQIDVQPLIDARIRYITKYMLKEDLESAPNEWCYPCFSTSSHLLGVQGFNEDYKFYNSNLRDLCDEYMKKVTLCDGQFIPVPRYFRKTVLLDEQRPFTVDEQQRQEKEQNDLKRKKFMDYVEKMRFKNPSITYEAIIRSYNQNSDYERKARVNTLQRRRRKGI